MSTPVKPEDILKRAAAVGSYYGFTAFSTVAAQKRPASRAPFPDTIDRDRLDLPAQCAADFFRKVRDAGIMPASGQPQFLWHTNAAAGRPSPKHLTIEFHALGADRAIADAVLMRAVRSLIEDLSKQQVTLRINSVGDKETRARCERELATLIRRNPLSFHETVTEAAKRDPSEALQLLARTSPGFLPDSTGHLSELSRKHFESVIEYLEASDTPYELTPTLMSPKGVWGETCFEVTGDKGIQAWGSRYGDFCKHFFKTPVPGMSAVIRIETQVREQLAAAKKQVSPRFVFVHIGDEAKRESMRMADRLRHARIPLQQSIGIESLTQQMQLVETVNPPYVIIMGRKEALERSVILRHRASYSEQCIPLDSLVDHLKGVT
jgi:histidyl-tRNA synthetase